MPTIDVKIGDFTGTYANLNGKKSLSLSQRKCLKFATTVGLSHLRPVHTDGVVALSLAAYRAMAVKCCLDFTSAKVGVHSEYLKLEQSEKANIAFWIGMTSAAALADAYLGVPRLIHATQFGGTAIQKANTASKSLADLLGPDLSGGYHVVEAKGRSRRPSNTDKQKWKAQAQTIGMIAGSQPATRSYSVAIINKALSIEWNDPPDPPSWTLNLDSNPDAFEGGYYEPFREFLRSDLAQSIDRGDRRLLVRVISYDPQKECYVFVGLQNEVLKPTRERLEVEIVELDDGDTYVGTDGVAIVTGPNPCELT